jgi:P-type Mg2+ transporter
MNPSPAAFWSVPADQILQEMKTTPKGLTEAEAQQRLQEFGLNLLKPPKKSDALTLLLGQFKSPIILILICAAGLSLFLQDPVDALIILIIVLVSGILGYWQERGAAEAVNTLLAIIQIKATVVRDGTPKEIPIEQIVPGDVIRLNAGDVIPGDGLILDSKDLFIDEASLTGETYPVEKMTAVLPAETPLAKRTNTLFMGTHVVSGSAKALMIRTGIETEFGKVSERLKLRPPETEFERGVRRFGYLLLEVTLMLVMAIFAINVYLARPVLESFLFSLALAVGLTPQLLPAIISINLAHGAKKMALKKVIVKRLSSIENFGSMNVLCSDKTGTLTEGTVKVHSALDWEGRENEKVLHFAYLNAFFESGFTNPIDQAVRTFRTFDLSGYQKLDEVPYDFIRKRLSILVSQGDRHLLITKGALSNVLSACSQAEKADGTRVDLGLAQEQIQTHFQEFSGQGFRMLGVAYGEVGPKTILTKDQEKDMIFLGFLVLFDPPKQGIGETINHLKGLGVSLKIITGDNHLVAATIGGQMGLANLKIITGPELQVTGDRALLQLVNKADIFAEVEPNQKERIILALRKSGQVVGYMGDGINDVSALHAADVAISVDQAVDVAKEAADIVLLEKDLKVLAQGIREGRTTFANTLKYVFMATSANFGNMFSMAGASLFLPFLPLLPKQILLTNLLTDFPELTIATDRVDPELVESPRRWNIRFIKNFMITFGLISSIFDYLTFGVLLFLLKARPEAFRTGWFIESVISASLIVLVIRTRQPFFKSKPGKALTFATLFVTLATLLIPYTPLGEMFGFQVLPFYFIPLMGLIVGMYILTAEGAKKIFYRRITF